MDSVLARESWVGGHMHDKIVDTTTTKSTRTFGVEAMHIRREVIMQVL